MSAQPSTDARRPSLADFVAANLRRNFSVLVADYGFFGLGLTFASVSTIVPAFAEHLGASNLVIGAIPSILTVGYTLPPLFFANYTERLPRKLRFILTYTVWERLPLLLLAGAAYFLAEAWPSLVLASLLVFLAAIAVVGGALMPAWMDLIGKVIPTNYRGRLFAYGSTLGAGLGLGGAVLSGYYLEAFPFPDDYALCFATGFVFLVLSYVSIALTSEPAVASGKPEVGHGEYFRRLPTILAGDRNFVWFLVSRAVGTVGAMANGFYTVFALRTLAAPEWEVARFTFILLAGQVAANLAFGYVADHVGHKPVLVVGTAAVVAGNAMALVSASIWQVYVVFLCMAVALAAANVSSLNLSMEFARPEDRPTYVGLGSTLVAPFAFVAPLVGGLLADAASYRAVFAVAGLAAAASVAVLAVRVQDPRRGARAGQAGSA